MKAYELSSEDFFLWLETPYSQEELLEEMKPDEPDTTDAQKRLRGRSVIPASFKRSAGTCEQIPARPVFPAFGEGQGRGFAPLAEGEIVSAPAGAEKDNFSAMAHRSQCAALRVPSSANSAESPSAEPDEPGDAKRPKKAEVEGKLDSRSRKKKKQLRISLFEAATEILKVYLPSSQGNVVSALIESWCAKVSPDTAGEWAEQCRRTGNLLNQTLHVLRCEGADPVLLADLDAQCRASLAFIRRLSGSLASPRPDETEAAIQSEKAGAKGKPYRSSRKKRQQFRISVFEETAEILEAYPPASRCAVISAILVLWYSKVPPEDAVKLSDECRRLGVQLNQSLHVIHREGADKVLLAVLEAQFREALAFIMRLSGHANG